MHKLEGYTTMHNLTGYATLAQTGRLYDNAQPNRLCYIGTNWKVMVQKKG